MEAFPSLPGFVLGKGNGEAGYSLVAYLESFGHYWPRIPFETEKRGVIRRDNHSFLKVEDVYSERWNGEEVSENFLRSEHPNRPYISGHKSGRWWSLVPQACTGAALKQR